MAREEAPISAPRSAGGQRARVQPDGRKSNKGLIWTIIVAVVVIIAAIAGYVVWSSSKNTSIGVDGDKYQAVFLANGQIYFGKLEAYNDEYLRLTTAYSAQQATAADTEEEATTEQASDVQLIRLGDELYGPENEIFISKQQILHYENMKSDSKVTQLIEQNEAAR